MRTHLLSYKPTPALILRAKQRAKECMSRTADPQECRPHFALVDELRRAVAEAEAETEGRQVVTEVPPRAVAEAETEAEVVAVSENNSLLE